MIGIINKIKNMIGIITRLRIQKRVARCEALLRILEEDEELEHLKQLPTKPANGYWIVDSQAFKGLRKKFRKCCDDSNPILPYKVSEMSEVKECKLMQRIKKLEKDFK